MSYNPEYFKNARPSERLLESAKASLDALGNYDHLKKDLEKSLFDGESQKKVSVDPTSFLKKIGKDADQIC
jgi:hypothetical protein